MKVSFSWGDYTVTVTNAGESMPPWGESLVYRYGVKVYAGGVVYHTHAWGSLHDYAAGDCHQHESLGAMVLDELAMAYADPEEFWAMAIGDERPSRERVECIIEVIDKAKEFGPSLLSVADMLRDKELV